MQSALETFLPRLLVLILSLSFLACSHSLAQEDISPSAEALIGRWDVDLYYSPSAPPSKTEMVITEAKDGKLAGTFYQSSFLNSGYTMFEDAVLFTVSTADNSGPYFTSGRLEGECIEGQTLSTGREFLMAWKACPAKDGAQ